MIRLARVGARKQPHYRVVVIEKDAPATAVPSKSLAPTIRAPLPPRSTSSATASTYWVGNGALLSDRVGKLFAAPVPVAAAAPTATPVAESVVEPAQCKSLSLPLPFSCTVFLQQLSLLTT